MNIDKEYVLLECPFCGSNTDKPRICDKKSFDKVGVSIVLIYVFCGECAAKSAVYYKAADIIDEDEEEFLKKQAARAWNRRSDN